MCGMMHQYDGFVLFESFSEVCPGAPINFINRSVYAGLDNIKSCHSSLTHSLQSLCAQTTTQHTAKKIGQVLTDLPIDDRLFTQAENDNSTIPKEGQELPSGWRGSRGAEVGSS